MLSLFSLSLSLSLCLCFQNVADIAMSLSSSSLNYQLMNEQYLTSLFILPHSVALSYTKMFSSVAYTVIEYFCENHLTSCKLSQLQSCCALNFVNLYRVAQKIWHIFVHLIASSIIDQFSNFFSMSESG